MVAIKGLSKRYHDGTTEHQVLAGVDLDIAAGEILVLLGRSGSGKSTLLNLISGIDQPSGGEVWIRGEAIWAMSETQRTLFRRRYIGFIFQSFNLVPTLTVEENVLLPLELNGELNGPSRVRALGLLERVGLLNRGASYPDRLSGGEQQRVAIARALVHEPLVLLADEPTGNLDAQTGQEVMRLLDELTREAGKTLVMVTHSAEIMGMADRLYTVRDGRLHSENGVG